MVKAMVQCDCALAQRKQQHFVCHAVWFLPLKGSVVESNIYTQLTHALRRNSPKDLRKPWNIGERIGEREFMVRE